MPFEALVASLLVGLPEELDDLLLGGLLGVSHAASILHGVLGQHAEVLRLGTQCLQILGDAHLNAEIFDGLQDRRHCLLAVLANLLEAHGVRDVDEELGHGLGVVLLDHSQQHRVADAMRRVVEAAQLVGHGVHVAKAGRVEGHACQELRRGHHVPRLQVLAIFHRLRQEVGNELHGVERARVSDGIRVRAHVGLNGMCQCIHARGCCE
mmetsp:Transcript_104461/g.253586  ORF Transcript_104461/g.253586 Transcript_104461/m.253586 type:complete len:209 (+) Transcript_104461:102-728(+)